MDWFSFWLNGFTVAAQGALHLLFSGGFTGKKLKIRYFALYLLLLCGIDTGAAALRFNGLAVGFMLLALYGVNRFLLGNSPSVSCVTAVIAVYVSQLSFGVINSVEFLLFPEAIGQTLLYLLIVLATLLSLGLCLCCYRFLSKRFSLQDNRGEPYVWMLLPPGVFFFAVEIYILRVNYAQTPSAPYPLQTGKHLALMALQILGLLALFCALYAYKHTCAGFKARAELASLEQETRAQKTYVAQAQMRYEQTKSFRHDIQNHLSVLGGLLKSGNLAQAQSYLQKLEAVTGELSFPVRTGNPVVDVLLGDKLELAKTGGTETELSLALPKPCAVDDFDLCVIFANALDNAIQACVQLEGPKSIRVAGERQGDFYMLEFENTCSPEPASAMGTGLSNIKAVAEKYGGAVTLEKTDSLFRLHVLLNISMQS